MALTVNRDDLSLLHPQAQGDIMGSLSKYSSFIGLWFIGSFYSQTSLSQDFTKHKELYQLIGQRLSLMEEVALYKYKNNKPVEDTKRETLVLNKAVEQAKKSGIKPETITDFFRTQIDLAKKIQRKKIKEWSENQSLLPQNGRSLDEVRKNLILLGNQIIAAVEPSVQERQIEETTKRRKLFHAAIEIPELSSKDLDRLFESAERIQLFQF